MIEIEFEKELNEMKDSIVITIIRYEHIRCPWMFEVMLKNVFNACHGRNKLKESQER